MSTNIETAPARVECGAHSSAVEPPAHNRFVPGSNPGGPTINMTATNATVDFHATDLTQYVRLTHFRSRFTVMRASLGPIASKVEPINAPRGPGHTTSRRCCLISNG